MGAAYGYRPFMEHPEVSVPLKVFSDAHNPPPERYYDPGYYNKALAGL